MGANDEALAWLCGDAITIADYYASAFVALGELLGSDHAGHPNVQRWLARMKALPSWKRVNEAIDGFGSSLDRSALQAV